MKLLKKLDNYLLENHPLLWLSKIHYVILAGVFLHFSFWLWGYLAIDHNFIIDKSRYSAFEATFAVYYFWLALIIFIIMWSFAFFKKSAARHLYPLGKLYFPKMFALLFLNFFIIISCGLSFRIGVDAKAQQLAPYEELKQNLELVNLGDALLPDNTSDYSEQNYFLNQHPEYEVVSKESWSNYNWKYNPYTHPEYNFVDLAGDTCQYVKFKTSQVGECDYNTTRVAVGAMKWPSGIEVQPEKLKFKLTEFVRSEDFASLERFNRINFDLYEESYANAYVSFDFNEKLRKLISNRGEVEKLLIDYEKFLTRMKVPHTINPKVLADYYQRNDGWIHPVFVKTTYDIRNAYNLSNEEYSRETKRILEGYNWKSSKITVEQIEKNWAENYTSCDAFFVKKREISEMYHWSKASHDGQGYYLELLIALFSTAALAFLFTILSFVDFINLIIAVPITGALIVINALLIVSSILLTHVEKIGVIIPIVSGILIVSWYLFQLFKQRSSKRLVSILGYISAFIAPFILYGIIALIEMTMSNQVLNCEGYLVNEKTNLMRWMEDPGFIISQAIVGMLLFTLTAKKLIAKPD